MPRTVSIQPIDAILVLLPLLEARIEEPLATFSPSLLLVVQVLLVGWTQPRANLVDD